MTDEAEQPDEAEQTQEVQARDPEPAQSQPEDRPDEPQPGASSPEDSLPASAAREAMPSAGLELYLLRHADAGDPTMWEGDDSDRPLSKRGRKQVRRLGNVLRDLDWKPDLILTSPKVRAADTAKLIGRKVNGQTKVDDRLGSGLDAASFGDLMAGLGSDVTSLVLVGHDPDFSSLASWLVGAPLTLRKGALARIDLPDRSVAPGRGALRWLLPPDAVAG